MVQENQAMRAHSLPVLKVYLAKKTKKKMNEELQENKDKIKDPVETSTFLHITYANQLKICSSL